LKQDKELFDSNPTFPLQTSKGSSFFFDKYHSYNAGARKYPYLQQLLDSKTIRINEREFGGPYRYVQRVQQDDELRIYLSPDRAGLIHGDSHAGNLLVEDGRVYMIDPKTTDPFPLEYDTGRMHWSLTGWNAIVRGQFALQQKDGGYTFDVTVPEQYVKGFPRFRAYFSERDYHRAAYSSAMQYVCRVSHAAKQDEATALYLRGLQVFDELFSELGVKV
jgi:aminoglycoside phosphotransferase (APT) family kinase protein